ncbi:MAG: hypothetical protein QOH56_4038 [Pseudonocardiales bacterium]|jgi:hypothetical protein|nr:hypothetical protein [Pseudonocardiales bacterium]
MPGPVTSYRRHADRPGIGNDLRARSRTPGQQLTGHHPRSYVNSPVNMPQTKRKWPDTSIRRGDMSAAETATRKGNSR